MLCMRIQSSDPFVNVLQTDFLLEEKVKIIKKTQRYLSCVLVHKRVFSNSAS